MIEVAIAEDHLAYRKLLTDFLSSNPDIALTAACANGLELMDAVKTSQPDVILLDLRMPVMSGEEVLPLLKQKYPSVKVIVLSQFLSSTDISMLVMKGARAVISKHDGFEEINAVIGKVYSDEYFFSTSVSRMVAAHFMKSKGNTEPILKILTGREIQVIKLLCDEKSAKQVADILNITYDTVDYHKREIYRKISRNSIAGLVKYAIRNGIVDLI